MYVYFQKLEEEKTALNNEKSNVLADTESLRKEQDDLLVLLSEQDGKIEEYKEKLKQFGCVSPICCCLFVEIAFHLLIYRIIML